MLPFIINFHFNYLYELVFNYITFRYITSAFLLLKKFFNPDIPVLAQVIKAGLSIHALGAGPALVRRRFSMFSCFLDYTDIIYLFQG